MKQHNLSITLFTVAASPLPYPEKLKKVREIGYRSIQSGLPPDDMSLKDYKILMDDLGMEICAFSGRLPLVTASPEKFVEACHLFDCDEVMVGCLPEEYRENSDDIIFTRDTHYDNYLSTQEGKLLPIAHCVAGSYGHKIASELATDGCKVFDKPTFGSLELAKEAAREEYDEIEICGLCTDICVVSNALILKAQSPEIKVTVDAECCAGVTVEGHNAALLIMKTCQVNVIMEEGQ